MLGAGKAGIDGREHHELWFSVTALRQVCLTKEMTCGWTGQVAHLFSAGHAAQPKRWHVSRLDVLLMLLISVVLSMPRNQRDEMWVD